MWAPWVFVLAQATASPWAGARPPECAALDTGPGRGVWERAKTPRLRRYCDLLASGASKLASSAGGAPEALDLAEQAAQLRPDRAAPSALKGRALVQLGRYEAAREALAAARATEPRALDEPLTLLAWARASSFAGRAEDAAAAYRDLLPRTSALPASERTAAFVEASAHALARGEGGIEDAVTCLRLALRDDHDGHGLVAPLLLALALDRGGAREEAIAVAAERSGDPRRLAASLDGRRLVPPLAAELIAAVAFALERRDRPAAQREWQRYLDAGGGGPWSAHARARVEALRRGGKP